MSHAFALRHLTLLLPGLFHGAVDNRYRALETLLARADIGHVKPGGYEARLLSLFGLAVNEERDIPVAALSLYGREKAKEEGMWLCADPVHLIADQSQVYLADPIQLPVSEEEAETLVSELNRFYAEEGYRFVMASPHHWYLHVKQASLIRTTPLREATGHAIAPLLPQGGQPLFWHRLMNELQMLLHNSAVNQVRQVEGKPAINGIWLWGGGSLPDASPSVPWQHIWAGNDLTKGLAHLHGIPVYGLPGSFAALERRFGLPRSSTIPQNDGLLVFDVLDDPAITTEVYAEWLERLEGTWFVPLLEALQQGKISQLTLDTADGRYWTLDTKMAKRWWRRRRPFAGYFSQH